MSDINEKLLARIQKLEREVERLRVQENGKFVALTTPLTSTSWTLSTARSSSGPTVIDLSAVFGVPANIKAVLVRLVARDSAGLHNAGLYVTLGPSTTYYYALAVYPVGGDLLVATQGIIPCDSNGDIVYKIVASGTDTTDVQLEIWGYFL